MENAIPMHWKRQIVAILAFGIAFGYVEAAVVTYLRPQFYSARATLGRDSQDLFPMLSVEQVTAAGTDMVRMLKTELVREAATLVMLGTVATAVSGNFRQWFAFFLLAFGAWDIAYYGFLKLLIDWPKSLLSWDILFLIPVPWSAPVLAPVLVALTMIGTGLVYLRRESNGRPIEVKQVHWLTTYAGAFLILASFVWDYRNVMAGGLPKPFKWSLFACGELIWAAAFLHWLGAARSLPTLDHPAQNCATLPE